MKKRGQKVRLKNPHSGEVVVVKVTLADSIQGYFAELPDGSARWYDPQQWEELK
tara:strand:- start:378 stop:539 length:162 start_codon:yes stop_codon:yes gene_type:complete